MSDSTIFSPVQELFQDSNFWKSYVSRCNNGTRHMIKTLKFVSLTVKLCARYN